MKAFAWMLVLGLFMFIAPLVFAYPGVPRPWQTWGDGTLEITLVSALGMVMSLISVLGMLMDWIEMRKEERAERERWNQLLSEFLKERE